MLGALQIDDVYFRVALELYGKLTIYFGHVDDVVGLFGGMEAILGNFLFEG